MAAKLLESVEYYVARLERGWQWLSDYPSDPGYDRLLDHWLILLNAYKTAVERSSK